MAKRETKAEAERRIKLANAGKYAADAKGLGADRIDRISPNQNRGFTMPGFKGLHQSLEYPAPAAVEAQPSGRVFEGEARRIPEPAPRALPAPKPEPKVRPGVGSGGFMGGADPAPKNKSFDANKAAQDKAFQDELLQKRAEAKTRMEQGKTVAGRVQRSLGDAKYTVSDAPRNALEAVKNAAPGIQKGAKWLGGLGTAAAVLNEGSKVADVYNDKDSKWYDVANQAARGLIRGGAGALLGTAGSVAAGPIGTVVGGVVGYEGADKLLHLAGDDPYEALQKSKAADASMAANDAQMAELQKQRQDPEFQYKQKMKALDARLAKGEDPEVLKAEALELQRQVRGVQGLLDADAAKPAPGADHPMMGAFREAMAMMTPAQRIYYDNSGNVDMTRTQGAMGNDAAYRHEAGGKMLSALQNIYNTDAQTGLARARMSYDMRKDAADSVSKFAPAWQQGKDGQWVPNEPANNVARTVISQMGGPSLDPNERMKQFSQGAAVGQMSGNIGASDPRLQSTAAPVFAGPARDSTFRDLSLLPGRNSVPLIDYLKGEKVRDVQTHVGPIPVSAGVASGGDQNLRRAFATVPGNY